MKRSLPRLPVLTVVPSLLIAAGLFGFSSPSLPAADAKAGISQTPKAFDSALPRHPVDLAFLLQGQRIVTANQGLGTLSLIDRQSGAVLHEVYCGQRPTAVVAFPDQSQLLAVCSESGSVNQWRLDHDRLVHVRDFEVGFEPIGITVDSRGQFAYVATQLNGRVVELDLNKGMRVREFAVGPWPRYLSLSPDGKRLTVGCSGDGKAYVLDVQGANASPNDPKSDGPEPLLPLYDVPLSGGINLGHFVCSADNTYAYFPR